MQGSDYHLFIYIFRIIFIFFEYSYKRKKDKGRRISKVISVLYYKLKKYSYYIDIYRNKTLILIIV